MPHPRLTLALLGACVLCSALPATAQDAYVLTPRLGPTIDAEERDYFGLFPDLTGFVEARAETVGDSVRFSVDARPDTELTVSREAAEALGRFVETFELSTTAFYNRNWQFVKDYVRPDVPVPFAGKRDDVALFPDGVTLFADGGRYTGRPVYASDSLILLAPNDAPYDWATFGADGTVLRSDEVDGVLLAPGWLGRPYVALAGIPVGLAVNEGLMGLSPNEDRDALQQRLFAAAAGMVVAKAVSIYFSRPRPYRQALSSLKEEAWFTPDLRPLEMPPESELRDQIAERPEPESVWYQTFGWVGLGAGAVSQTGDGATYGFFSNFEPEAGTVEQAVRYKTGGALLEAAAAIQPLAWLDLGVGVYLAPDQPLGNTDLQEVATSQPSVRFFADLDVVRLIAADSRFGLALGGGLLRSESRLAFSVPPVTGQSGTVFTYSPDGYALEASGFEPFYQAMLSVGLAREASLYLSVHGYAAPSIDVPLFEAAPDINPNVTVFRVEPHTVDFRFLGFGGGVRLSF